MSGSRCYPGRSTYGGDTRSRSVREFGSGDGPGQWTHGGDIKLGTVRAFGSECGPGDNGIAKVHDEPMIGSDSGWSLMKFTDAMWEEALKIRAAVPFPAGGVGRLALSPAEECTCVRDMCDNDISSEGFQRWNTDQDILNQYETFNGLPVYYGSDCTILRIRNGTIPMH